MVRILTSRVQDVERTNFHALKPLFMETNHICAECLHENDYLDDLNGSVGSITDLILKGPGFESQIRHGFSQSPRYFILNIFDLKFLLLHFKFPNKIHLKFVSKLKFVELNCDFYLFDSKIFSRKLKSNFFQEISSENKSYNSLVRINQFLGHESSS
jgi:hypothetical protein